MKRYPWPFAILLLLLTASGCRTDEGDTRAFQEFFATHGGEVDLWIRGGYIYTGLDSQLHRQDLLLKGDSIAFVGLVDSQKVQATRTIDAAERLVTPGFIDTHAHGDPLQNPDFQNFLAMGVTTLCLGQDGGSPREADLSTWMRQVEDTVPGVNIAMFVGHGTLRHLSGAGYEQQPSAGQLEKMRELLRAAFSAGCFGMSTGLEYTPGLYAGEEELISLARIVGENNGVLMSHMRNEDNDAIEDSLRELMRQGAFCHVHASHLKVVYGKGPERAKEILAIMDSARAAGPFPVTADIYPYTASYTGIGIVFPTWAKAPNDYATVKRNQRDELLTALREKVISRNGPEATLLGTGAYAGKTLAELSDEAGKPFEEVLLDMGPNGASGAYFVMDESLQARLLQDPNVMVCSDGSPTMHHPRGYGSFAKIIETYVEEDRLLTLPQALYKMTALPARTLGLNDRGVIRPGAKADLLIFDPESVHAAADFTQPHRLAEGFDFVLVNGKVARERGEAGPERHGAMLRKQP